MPSSAEVVLKQTRTIVLAALLLLAGCSSIFGPDEPDLTLSLRGEAGHLDRVSALVVDVGGRDFRLDADGPRSRAVHAPRDGTLSVRVALLGSAIDTLGTAVFEQRFREDDNHWISGMVGLQRPVGMCIGLQLAVPLVPASAGVTPDTLYLMYGSIPKDAIC